MPIGDKEKGIVSFALNDAEKAPHLVLSEKLDLFRTPSLTTTHYRLLYVF